MMIYASDRCCKYEHDRYKVRGLRTKSGPTRWNEGQAVFVPTLVHLSEAPRLCIMVVFIYQLVLFVRPYVLITRLHRSDSAGVVLAHRLY